MHGATRSHLAYIANILRKKLKEKTLKSKNLRDYGLGNSEAIGVPQVLDQIPEGYCPNCGCKTVYLISVDVESPPMLRVPDGHCAVSTYSGCPACPWASPAMVRARPMK